MMMDEIKRLERELKESRDKIMRICKWVREEHGIIIPEFILNPPASPFDSDGHPTEDTNINQNIEFVQVQGVNLISEQFDENDDLFPDFDENEYIEERPSKLPSKDLFLKCKPCYVLLPPRIDHQPHHKDQIKPDPSSFSKIKIKPTVDERMRALYICQTYSPASTNCPIICPITSCSHYFPYTMYTKGLFTRHLTRMHFFHQLDVKKPIRFTSENTKVDKIILQKKPKSSIEHKKDIKSTNYSFPRVNYINIGSENDEIPSQDQNPQSTKCNENIEEIPKPAEETHDGIRKIHWRQLKKRPTVDEKAKTLQFYKTTASFLNLKCPICLINIKSRSKFKRHLTRIHYFEENELNIPEEKVLLTQEQKVQALKSLQDYSQDHNTPLVCPICPNKKFSQVKSDENSIIGLKSRFKYHLKYTHMYTKFTRIVQKSRPDPNDPTGFLCTLCGKFFTKSCYLKKHTVRHHSTNKPKFQCDTCSTFFHYKGDLNMHKISHSTEKNYTCQVCGSGFKTSRYLKNHLLIHGEDRNFKCLYENCGKSFKQVQALQIHSKRVHTVDVDGQHVKKHHCDKCDKYFFSWFDLKKHTRAVHEHLRPFKCTMCLSAFKTTTHLKYHINTHSNPKSKKRGFNKPKDL